VLEPAREELDDIVVLIGVAGHHHHRHVGHREQRVGHRAVLPQDAVEVGRVHQQQRVRERARVHEEQGRLGAGLGGFPRLPDAVRAAGHGTEVEPLQGGLRLQRRTQVRRERPHQPAGRAARRLGRAHGDRLGTLARDQRVEK